MKRMQGLVYVIMIVLIILVLVNGCATGTPPQGATTEENPGNQVEQSESQTIRQEEESQIAEVEIEGEVDEDATLVVFAYTQIHPYEIFGSPSTAPVPSQIFETLVYQDESMELQPMLATAWEPVDDYTVQFTLREGVVFHDGSEFNADDVMASFNWIIENDGWQQVQGILDSEKLVKTGEYSVQVGFHQPYLPSLSYLAHYKYSILSEEMIAATEGLGTGSFDEVTPIGTGAYKFIDMELLDNNNGKVMLERFDDYWGEPAKTKNIIFEMSNYGDELDRRKERVEKGDLHLVYDATRYSSDFLTDGKFDLLYETSIYSKIYALNTTKPPLDNQKIRQAINYCMEEPFGTSFIKAGGAVSPNVLYADKNIKGYEYDLEKAKQLLKDAGADGLTLNYGFNVDIHSPQYADELKYRLAEIGIELHIQEIKDNVMPIEEVDIFLLPAQSNGDPDSTLYPAFYGQEFEGRLYPPFYNNQRVDELLDQGRHEEDPSKREKIYLEIQSILLEEAPAIFAYCGYDSVAVGEKVAGFTMHPNSRYRLKDVVIYK